MSTTKAPNFLIVGAAKSGTTALHYYLRQHPEIFLPGQQKETFFFSGIDERTYPGPGGSLYGAGAIRTWEAYQALFADVTDQRAVGEACVAYLYFHRQAIPRMQQRLGNDVRIIMCLRDPCERAFSNYLHHRRDLLEPLRFGAAIRAEAEREAAKWWWGFQYTRASMYHDQVMAYLDAFGRDRVLVLLYEEFEAHPMDVLRKIFRFLEVDEQFRPDISMRHNASVFYRSNQLRDLLAQPDPLYPYCGRWFGRKRRERYVGWLQELNAYRPRLGRLARARLLPAFRADIRALQGVIDLDLSGWLS